jgi:hypothetical protein
VECELKGSGLVWVGLQMLCDERPVVMVAAGGHCRDVIAEYAWGAVWYLGG